jgi:hypothetical protein
VPRRRPWAAASHKRHCASRARGTAGPINRIHHMSLAELACWVAVVLTGVKLLDAADLYLKMVFTDRTPGEGQPPVPFVFRFAARYPLLAPLVDAFWRAPFLLLVAVPVTFVAAGSVEGWLLITTAALAVAVAVNPVTTLLLSAALPNKFSTEDVLDLAGLYYHRAGKPEHKESDGISAVPTVVSVAFGYLAGFAALYFALSHGSSHAFVAAAGKPTVRLDWTEALFYSVTTGTTLGDATTSAASVATRAVVAVQVLATGAAVTLYAAFLLKSLVDRKSNEASARDDY